MVVCRCVCVPVRQCACLIIFVKSGSDTGRSKATTRRKCWPNVLGELEDRGLGARSSCLPTIASYLEWSARNAVYQWFNGNVVRHDTALKKTLTTVWGSTSNLFVKSMSEHQGSGKRNSNFCVLKRITHLRWLSLSQDYDDYDYHLNRSQTSNIRQYLTNLTCVYNCVYNCIHVSQRASQVAHHPPKTAGVSISSWVSQTASAGRPTKPGWSLGRCPTDGTWWDPWRVWEGFSLLKFLCLNMCGRSGRWLSDYILIIFWLSRQMRVRRWNKMK